MDENSPHILVVDDDSRLRNLLSKYLKENKFFVTVAKDAVEARERLKTFLFDLLIMDVMMPGENGMDLLTDLRKEMSLPILMLTAMGEVENRIIGLEAGADDYLSKPFEPRE